MPTLAIAHLQAVNMGPAIVEYLERIDDTLAPFGGKFVVHGAQVQSIEGEFAGDIVVIAFPDREHAQAWHASPAYQAILPLRTENADSVVVFIDTVSPGHRSTDLIPLLTSTIRL